MNRTYAYWHNDFGLKLIKKDMAYIPLYLVLQASRPLLFFRKTDSTFLWFGVATVCFNDDWSFTNESVNWSTVSNVVNIITLIQDSIPNRSSTYVVNAWISRESRFVSLFPKFTLPDAFQNCLSRSNLYLIWWCVVPPL